MHAVIITFRSTAPPDSLIDTMKASTDAILAVDGFVSKVWLRDGDTFGGSYVFDSEESAANYVGSDLVAGLRHMEGFSDVEVRTFSVIEELTATTAAALIGA